jgi:hypothetical protein
MLLCISSFLFITLNVLEVLRKNEASLQKDRSTPGRSSARKERGRGEEGRERGEGGEQSLDSVFPSSYTPGKRLYDYSFIHLAFPC